MDYVSIAKRDHSKPAAEGTWVVIADVKNSTEAMKSGRQKDVNLVGTACIAAMRNHYAPEVVPYVFGGDGATFLISEDKLDHCLDLLKTVQSNALFNLGLELRVGKVSLTELRSRSADIYVGLLKGKGIEVVPYFRGPGIALADKLIKEQWSKEKAVAISREDAPPDLSGLSCMHRPFYSQRGKILSVIIEPLTESHDAEEDEILEAIFTNLTARGALNRLRPIQNENLQREWLGSWESEAKLKSSAMAKASHIASKILTFVRHLRSAIVYHLDFVGKIVGKNSAYMARLLQQSDWIKMDGALRLVIDVNPEEEKDFRALLERLRQDKRIVYGLHESDSALMTCHLRSIRTQEHSHFIDGSDGGLTIAATQLKAQRLKA